MPSEVTELYGPNYYKSHCGPIPYDRSHPHWLEFFGNIADELVRVFRPKCVFDAGCAKGFLLEALWDRGVETWGRDVSEFAVSEVRTDVRPFASVGSIAEPISGTYDLVTCIEVLEHMTVQEGAQAIANMTAVGQRIVFSSSPTDLDEPTHINVKPPIYWLQAFAKHNFHPAIAITLPSITPYTLVFERRDTSPTEEFLLACAEIVRGRAKIVAEYHAYGALTARVAELTARAAELTAHAAGQDQIIVQRETMLTEQTQVIAQRDKELAGKREEFGELAHKLLQVQQELANKDETIRHTEHKLAEQNNNSSSFEQMVETLEQEHQTLEQAVARYEQELIGRNAVVADLINTVQSSEALAWRAQSEYQTVLASTTWRSTALLRAAIGRLPRPVRRRARQALKLAYWSATLKLGGRLRQRRQLLASAAIPVALQLPPSDSVSETSQHILAPETAELAAHPIIIKSLVGFDAVYYLQENADVLAAALDPVAHYLNYGQAEGRHPSALAAGEAEKFRLADLCDPNRDEPGPRAFDESFCISVLTPTYNTEPRYLRELYQTLRNQRYANWEWVVADDGSTDARTVVALRELARSDERIRLTLSPKNLGISGASNLALANVSGTYTALVDHDDLVARDAFLALYEAWKTAPATQLFFTDECKLLPDGQLGQFWPKPSWSPAYLENTMCLGHLSVYETSFLRSLGGFRSAYDGTQDFDLALRASLAGPKVVHLPSFAYLWRVIPGSAAADINEKHYAIERQGKAVLDYARHRHSEATVFAGWGAGYWRISYPLPTPTPLLSYVIPTGGGSRIVRGQRVDLLLNCVCSFEESNFYPNCEYVIVHNGNLKPEQIRALEKTQGVRLIHYNAQIFNFSDKLNLGVESAQGEYICLLNDDVEAITPEGGRALVSYLAANPTVGAIGPMCLYENGTIQQNGIVLTSVGPAHAGDKQPANFGGHQAMLNCRRESFCIGGAVMFVRKDVFETLGGFDSTLPLNYNDVDFGIRLRESGLTCVVDPDTQVYHFEGATKTGTSTVEQERFFLKHPGIFDPYFSHWFKQDRTTYQIDLRRGTMERPFGAWLDRHIAKRARLLVPNANPKLSVCVSVYNQPQRLLEEMYNSVLMQTYLNKELVILDNGSLNPETLEWLCRVREEGRSVVARLEINAGIEGGNRRLLELMTGEFFVAMDADDFLSVDALQMLAHTIARHPGRRLFYSDEYKSDVNSSRFLPFYKPDFDPILLMNCCYPAHLMAMDAVFLRELGAYTEPRAAWSHDYDTLTRALAAGEEPVHVRELIYGWRIHPGSTASAGTFGKPETVGSQRFVIERLLTARGLSHVLTLEPNTIETSSGMWRLRANEPLAGIRRFNADDVWGENGLGVAGLAAAALGAEWIAILEKGDPESALLELSAPAWLDKRVVAVGGIFVDARGTVCWSGGLFLPEGGLFDPYAGSLFAEGGYHGQLWCQRCVDVLAPIQVLIRADALQRAANRPGGQSAEGLMAMLGLGAHETGEFLAVTPHHRCRPPAASLPWLPLDRAGVLLRHEALVMGSRWYDGRLKTQPIYSMPGQA